VRGARGNSRPYRDQTSILARDGYDVNDPKRPSSLITKLTYPYPSALLVVCSRRALLATLAPAVVVN
jgi:hypothetical protein